MGFKSKLVRRDKDTTYQSKEKSGKRTLQFYTFYTSNTRESSFITETLLDLKS